MSKASSIREKGLNEYLTETLVSHRNLGYDVFCTMVEAGASITSMAKSFNVSRFTIDKWLSVYREEKIRGENNARPNSKIT